MIRIIRAAIIACLLLGASGATAQWQEVAAGLLGRVSMYGAMHFVPDAGKGTVYAGIWGLWRSKDQGTTWQEVTSFPAIRDPITDIHFSDPLTGVVSTWQGGIWRTLDGGATWHSIGILDYATSVKIMSSPDTIVATLFGSGAVVYDGISWSLKPFGRWSNHVVLDQKRDPLVLTGPTSGFIQRSRDKGATWTRSAVELDYDSYSLGLDPCTPDARRIFVINEDHFDPRDFLGEIFVSSDAGSTWRTTLRNSYHYLCGNLAVEPHAVYTQTLFDGILRSTDLGETWQSIGGPSDTADQRLIVTLSDNFVLAADKDGTIWRTTNSGGDSVLAWRGGISALSETSLFVGDTIYICDLPLRKGFALTADCGKSTLEAYGFDGTGAAAYALGGLSSVYNDGDSIFVTLRAQTPGVHTAELWLEFNGGKQLRLTLGATVLDKRSVSLAARGSRSDTLGAIARVPIELTSSGRSSAVRFRVRYDTSQATFNGIAGGNGEGASFELGETGEVWITIPPDEQKSESWWLLFAHFPRGRECMDVIVDSVRVPDPSACLTAGPDSLHLEICNSLGCGSDALSAFLRYKQPPKLTIAPNPSRGRIGLNSDEDAEEVHAELLDVLGRSVSSSIVSLIAGTATTLDLATVVDGDYFLRLRSETWTRTLPVRIRR